MTSFREDPLLAAGTAVVTLMQVGVAIGGVALTVGAPLLALYHDDATAAFARDVGRPNAELPLYAIEGVLMVGLAACVLLFLFFGRLRRIIATVGEGDPFQPENARRLGQMGWLVLAVQLLAIPAMALAVPILQAAERSDLTEIAVAGKVDFGLLLMTLVLFILARVFKRGAEMRDELEGTV